MQERVCWQSGQVVGAGSDLSGGGSIGVERTSAGKARRLNAFIVARRSLVEAFLGIVRC